MFVVSCLVMAPLASPIGAQDSEQRVKNLILPGESFLINNRPAFILWPEKAKRKSPQPWVMYGPTLPAYPDIHEKWMHQQFLDAGIAIAGIDVGEAYGNPASQEAFTELHSELTQNRGFASKPCLLGRSRGGLWTSSWAIRNTDKVAGISGIYPVFDLQTYPGLDKAAPAYGLSPEELEQSLGTHNPIAQADKLASARIPVYIIHGDVDHVVPLNENSATLARSTRRQTRRMSLNWPFRMAKAITFGPASSIVKAWSTSPSRELWKAQATTKPERTTSLGQRPQSSTRTWNMPEPERKACCSTCTTPRPPTALFPWLFGFMAAGGRMEARLAARQPG